MKFSIALFIALISSSSFAQTIPKQKDNISAKTTDQIISDIRIEYKRINSLPLVQKKYKFTCDVEGTITYYTDNGKVVKILIDWGVIGDGTSTCEYYFKEGKLIFSHEISIGGPAIGPDTKKEYRTYVNNDKTIKYMENQKALPCSTCQFDRSSIEYKALDAYKTNHLKAALCN